MNVGPTIQQKRKNQHRKHISKSYKETLPPHHKFHKLFNKNTVKISYGFTRNIKTLINSHNAKILFPQKVLNKEHELLKQSQLSIRTKMYRIRYSLES